MSIRRKRRQRGKLRVERRRLREEAAKTWAALNAQPAEPPLPGILRLIRNAMPPLIASEIVGVQPMTMPVGMIKDMVLGVDSSMQINHRYTDDIKKKKTPYQRKKERAAQNRERRALEKTYKRIKANAAKF